MSNICKTCEKRPIVPGKTKCRRCLDSARRSAKNRTLNRQTAKVCIKCQSPDLLTKNYCKKCNRKHLMASRKWYAKNKEKKNKELEISGIAVGGGDR